MTRSLLILLLCCYGLAPLPAQFIGVPPVQDGVIGLGEYGSTVNGTNQLNSAGITWHMTWDATNLYVAIQGANVSEGAVMYFDTDPLIPVNGGADNRGSLSWFFDYDRTRHIHPIRSDFTLYLKHFYHEYRHADGAGDWSGPIANTLSVWANAGTQIIEVAIPWNAVTNGSGRPPEFNWYGYKLYDYGDGNNGSYAPVPEMNPTVPNNAGAGGTNEVYVNYYFSIISTDNLTSTAPFAARSFTYHNDYSVPSTGGYYIGSETFFDFTINDNSPDNSDNSELLDTYNNNGAANRVLIGGDVIINRNLAIGQGSALFPANNTAGAINASITMDGSQGFLYNHGRIDCTPEVAVTGHETQRRLAFIFDGNTEYLASPLFKDRARFSDVEIRPGKRWGGPSTGLAQVEFQYGTMLNQGTLDFHTTTGGTMTFDTRGDNANVNNYYLSSPDSTGVYILDGLLIGRRASILQPLVNGGLSTLQVHGDFENYDRFFPQVLGGGIDIVMTGNGRQQIMGDITETFDAQTTFHNLKIDNDNGASDANTGADVHFVSSGGGQINYVLTGTLELASGDLVTRDRSNSSIAHMLILDSAAMALESGAQSEDGSGRPSCYVDGPLYRVHDAVVDTMNFPIGKDGSLRRTDIALYRTTLGYARDTTVAELYHESAYTLNNSIPITPEVIDNISLVHWWHVSNSEPFSYDSAKVLINYDLINSNDGVPDPANLRLLKAPSGGFAAWTNVSPFRGAVSTGAGVGYIWSDRLLSFSDFTLGNLGTNPLPVELLNYSAKRVGERAQLDWSTASEVNNSHFEIYHSSDGLDFELIGLMGSAGNSSSQLDYRFYDEKPQLGVNYYRLLQFDLDGAQDDLGVRAVFIDSADLSLYPNPVVSELYVSGLAGLNARQYRVLDMSGREVFRGLLGTQNTQRINPDLSPGRYNLQVQGPSGEYNLPFLRR